MRFCLKCNFDSFSLLSNRIIKLAFCPARQRDGDGIPKPGKPLLAFRRENKALYGQIQRNDSWLILFEEKAWVGNGFAISNLLFHTWFSVQEPRKIFLDSANFEWAKAAAKCWPTQALSKCCSRTRRTSWFELVPVWSETFFVCLRFALRDRKSLRTVAVTSSYQPSRICQWSVKD